MNRTLRKYLPLWLGGLLTLALTLLLAGTEVILIDPEAVGENLVIFTLWWLVISFAIYRFGLVASKRVLLQHLGTLLALGIGIFIVEDYADMPDNPITIGLLIAIWLYLIFWLAPDFSRKYRILLIGLYGLLFLIFVAGRLNLTNYFEYQENFILSFLWPIPYLAALWVYEQWKWFKSIEKEKTDAELALLKSQINPHFFFNTLNNLHALTLDRAEAAPPLILKLSDMMRYTIYEGKKELVPVQEEVAYLQNYIELHSIRQHEKVTITFSHDCQEGVWVSPLLFIVLLENAFKHGAERLLANAFIELELTATLERIDFRIRNNFDPDELPDSPGLGLENLRRRLELIYPKHHQLSCTPANDVYTAHLIIEPLS